MVPEQFHRHLSDEVRNRTADPSAAKRSYAVTTLVAVQHL